MLGVRALEVDPHAVAPISTTVRIVRSPSAASTVSVAS